MIPILSNPSVGLMWLLAGGGLLAIALLAALCFRYAKRYKWESPGGFASFVAVMGTFLFAFAVMYPVHIAGQNSVRVAYSERIAESTGAKLDPNVLVDLGFTKLEQGMDDKLLTSEPVEVAYLYNGIPSSAKLVATVNNGNVELYQVGESSQLVPFNPAASTNAKATN